MTKFKLVTYGRLSKEFHEWSQKEYPTLEVKHATPKEQLALMLQDANAYAGFYALDGLDASHLKWIHAFGAGVDLFLSNKSIVDHRIPISRTSGQLGRKIGEYCLAHVLNHFKEIEKFKDLENERKWEQLSTRNLYECNVLILGTGAVGSGIANLFKGLAKSVTGLNQSGKTNSEFDYIIGLLTEENYDIIINTLPETKQTIGFVNNRFFNGFRNSFFINVGRGSAVVTNDLVDALIQGNLTAAVLDVFEKEPLDKESELWDHKKVTITPHISGITSIEDVMASFGKAFEQILNNQTGDLFVNYENGY